MSSLNESSESIFVEELGDENDEPARAEGWIKVFEEGVIKYSRRGSYNFLNSLRWQLKFCVLDYKTSKLHHFNNELDAGIVQENASGVVLRLNPSRMEYYSRWNHSSMSHLGPNFLKTESSTLPRKLSNRDQLIYSSLSLSLHFLAPPLSSNLPKSISLLSIPIVVATSSPAAQLLFFLLTS
ncbi:uncharacterized protein LOC119734569 [Patiria miniata]|uniref:Uncharacterized protein n=1 Tax=Patiria miniata TaxID=46514 RepID=A0A914AK87_PATMI|nr:uncharacterized protein LOC119734569 [Patiria miniata]